MSEKVNGVLDLAPPAAAKPAKQPYARHEVLSHSESGLHYVRDRKSGILRRLTDAELHDFDDPPPCEECGEQFGCNHYNCQRERLLSDAETDAEVPAEFLAFARDNGVSRADIERLQYISEENGEYRLAPNAPSDMRTLELVLLLNEWK